MLLFLDVCMVGKKAVSSPYSVLVTTLRVLRRGHSQLWRQLRASGCRAVGIAKIQPLEGTDGFVQQRVHVTAGTERFSSAHVFKEKLYLFSMPVELAVVIQVPRSFLHLTSVGGLK